MSSRRRKLVAIDDPLSPRTVPPRPSATNAASPNAEETAALYVRLRVAESDRLARAAFELRAHKREIVGALIAHYVDGESDEGRRALTSLLEEFRQLCA